MNVYDSAHTLAKAIKESQEYKDYERLKAKTAENADLSGMLKDFQAKQFALQAKQMMGEELGPEVLASVQEMYGIISRDPLAAEYLQAEMRFSIMMNDVYKILGEAVGLGGIGQEGN